MGRESGGIGMTEGTGETPADSLVDWTVLTCGIDSRGTSSPVLIGAKLGRLERRPSFAAFGFLIAAADSLRLTVGVDADRGPGLGRAAGIAPGVALTLDRTGKDSDTSMADDGVFSLEVVDGVKSALRWAGAAFSPSKAESDNDGKSSGGGLIERRGSEVGEFVSSLICFGDSLSTLAGSTLTGSGEARPLVLRFRST